ncbi:hypothetical protein [Sphingopyxis flava]|uniref:Beta-lactamase-inhibitor-like, PepSY-like n=1 Tax=Sphingopyxis flava TaxID=1507287 RepID=A0A1T5EZ25_9SPHN|nr:hypothetical protein [Sphingopyxis flava]SKB89202.1 hypothetical protein SAMN06295937_102655 [Sphingopyxis flava]
MRRQLAATLAILLTAACGAPSDQSEARGEASAVLPSGPEAQIDAVAAANLPAGVREAVLSRVPGMTITGAERKQRDGMIFYDVEGTRPDGSEVELDLLEDKGRFTIVEVQRDIRWAEAPAPVIAAARAAPDAFEPVRVIESMQEDGTVIYELFAAGNPEEPASEIDWKDGRAAVRRERAIY